MNKKQIDPKLDGCSKRISYEIKTSNQNYLRFKVRMSGQFGMIV